MSESGSILEASGGVENSERAITPQLPEGESEEDARAQAATGAQTSLAITIAQVVF